MKNCEKYRTAGERVMAFAEYCDGNYEVDDVVADALRPRCQYMPYCPGPVR